MADHLGTPGPSPDTAGNHLRVSVIIPVYNQAQFVGHAIDSVLRQDYDDYEIIVVDDGSVDTTPQVLARYEPRVTVIRRDNGGLSAARNTGIRAARGDLVALLDSDDEYEAGCLAAIVSAFNRRADADAIYCVAQCIDESGARLPQRIGRVVEASQFGESLLEGGFFPPICMFARRHCYERDGHLFDESLRRVEDVDLWLKFADRYRVVGIPDVLTRYRITPQGLSSDPERVLQHRMLVLRRHFARTGQGPIPEETQRNLFARSYLAATTDALQLADVEQAYAYLRQAFTADARLMESPDVFYELALGDQPRGFRGTYLRLDAHRSAVTLLGLLDRLFQDPATPIGVQSERRAAYGHAYFALGLLNYGLGRVSVARAFLGQAVLRVPRIGRDRRFLTAMTRSMLPARLVGRLRRTRATSTRRGSDESRIRH